MLLPMRVCFDESYTAMYAMLKSAIIDDQCFLLTAPYEGEWHRHAMYSAAVSSFR